MRLRYFAMPWMLAFAIGILAGPGSGRALAQSVTDGRESPAMWRRWVLGAAGAVVGTVPALLGASSGQASDWCGFSNCDALVSGVVAGGLGYLIGRERDERIRQQWRIGPTLKQSHRSHDLPFVPLRVVPTGERGILVVGDRGVATIDEDLRLAIHPGELRGVAGAVFLPDSGPVIVATSAGLIALPLAVFGQVEPNGGSLDLGRRIHPIAAEALLVVPRNALLAGTTDSIVRMPLDCGEPGGCELGTGVVVETLDSLVAAAYSQSTATVWTLEGRRLIAREPATLQLVSALVLPDAGRFLVVDGTLAAIGSVAEGIFLVNLEDPANPRLVVTLKLEGVHAAAASVLDRDRLYVAAGQQGLLVFEVIDRASPRRLGVIRGVGSADAVAVVGSTVYIVDRQTRRLRQVEPRD
jgi:hypothetical protein